MHERREHGAGIHQPAWRKSARFFESGQVRHATAPGKEGLAAFNDIVTWKGGTISEVSDAPPATRTITQNWQVVLMEAARESDERTAASAESRVRPGPAPPGEYL